MAVRPQPWRPDQGRGLVKVPPEVRHQRILRRPQTQAVDVALGHRVLAGEEPLRRRLRPHHADVLGQVRVQGRQEAVRLPGAGCVDQHTLGPGMHPRIGAPRALGHGRLGIEGAQRHPEIPLAAAQARLDLPAVEASARIGHGEEVGEGHKISIIGPDPPPMGFPTLARPPVSRSTGICDEHGTYMTVFSALWLFHGVLDGPRALIFLFF
jgi:hypothetical protein